MDTCLESVDADVEIVIMRQNKAAPDGKTCLWSNVEGHPLFSNGIEFHLNPN